MRSVKGMVKGIAVLAVVMGFMAGGVSSSHALTTSSSLATSISVNSVFRLTLATFKGGPVSDATRFDLVPVASLNFGSVTVGQASTSQPTVVVPLTGGGTAESGLIMKAESNQGNVWRFQVSENQPLTRTGGSQTIADANFRYFTWIVGAQSGPPPVPAEATGTLATLPLQNPDGSRFNAMSTTPFTIYTSSSGEGFTTDTRAHMQFNVIVPAVTPGTYTNNVVITLTE